MTLASPSFPEYVDSSMISEFNQCEHAFFRRYIQHLVARGTSIHLHAGGAFAKGIQEVRQSFYEQRLDSELSLARGIVALLQDYGDVEIAEDSRVAKDWLRMAGALDYYFEVWPIETDPLRPIQMGGPDGKRGIECSFALPLDIMHPETGNPIFYAGRFDMLAEHEGSVFVVDEKTASQLGDSWSAKWDLRGQITGYIWAAQQFGIPVAGAIIRGVSILKTGYGNAEASVLRAQWEIDRWLEQTHRKVERMIACWRSGQYLYNLGDSCDAYGGCGYKRLCLTQEPESYIPVYYEESHWSPLNPQ